MLLGFILELVVALQRMIILNLRFAKIVSQQTYKRQILEPFDLQVAS